MVIIFYDLETTGVNYKQNCIHEFAGIVTVNHEIVENFSYKLAPHPKAKIELSALKHCGVTLNQIEGYPDQKFAYKAFVKMLSKYVNKFDKQAKIFLAGFRNSSFDDQFLRYLFLLNKDDFFGSWFWSNSIDVSVLATEALLAERPAMPSFKLHRVAKTLGIEVRSDELHGALYDATITLQIYYKLKGIEVNLASVGLDLIQ